MTPPSSARARRRRGPSAPTPRIVGLLGLLGLLGLVAAPPATAQTAGDGAARVLERAAERYAVIDGFCATFEQERIVPLLSQTTRSRGTLCQKPPGYFRMDFSQPEGDLVVADGEHVWTYYPSTNPGQVIRARIGAAGGRTFDFHREFLADAGERFRVRRLEADTVTGRRTDVLELEPRREGAGYVRARVWVETDRGLIRKVEIVEENESLRRVVLSGIRVNPGLKAENFAFQPPEGVQVIRR